MLVAPSSSSTKKAAKLAKSGQGQEGSIPGRNDVPAHRRDRGGPRPRPRRVRPCRAGPAADASAPTIDDHWHMAYGFYLCDTWVQLTGNKEDPAAPGYDEFARTGIHSHDDGVVHWHPFTSASVGKRAKLSVFLDVYGVELTDDKLDVPRGPAGSVAVPDRDRRLRRGRDEVRRRRRDEGRRTQGDRVEQLLRHRRRHDLRRRLRQHPRHAGRDGVLDRIRPAGHRRRDAAVGRQPARARRGRHRPGRPRARRRATTVAGDATVAVVDRRPRRQHRRPTTDRRRDRLPRR